MTVADGSPVASKLRPAVGTGDMAGLPVGNRDPAVSNTGKIKACCWTAICKEDYKVKIQWKSSVGREDKYKLSGCEKNCMLMARRHRGLLEEEKL